VGVRWRGDAGSDAAGGGGEEQYAGDATMTLVELVFSNDPTKVGVIGSPRKLVVP
jgi:hypothetical protein